MERYTTWLNGHGEGLPGKDCYTRLAQYEDLEDRLNGISIEQVVNGFIRTIEGQTHEDYEHGRILTNAEAEKWNEYKQLDEQGLLLRLPVKAGDTVYALRYGEENDFIIVETKIIEIRQNMNGIFFEPLISRKAYKTEDFGKIVFLTQEEAERKLMELTNSSITKEDDVEMEL